MTACLLALGLLAGTAIAEQAGTDPYYRYEDLFTNRDLEQTADTSDAETITVSDGSDIRITQAGTYVLNGSASGVTVYVEAGDEDKVQLVLDGVSVTNPDFPCIYVVSADKVFITTAADSTLSVTGTFRADGSTNTDGVIFSRDDLVLGGTAVLNIVSPNNGVVCKDDLKITGGTYVIQASSKAFEANDSIRIAGGTFRLTAGTDGLHAENKDDNSMGYVFIGGGTFTIQAGDDGIHATSVQQIDDGVLDITAGEGLESTVIQINGGTLNITSADDGINAARKSSSYTPVVIFNGGEVTIAMGRGDTDGVDSNGNIMVNGGTVSVTGNSTFDYDGTGIINGGAVYANGQLVSSLPNQMMGGGGRGGFGGWDNGGQDNGGWGGPGGWGGRGR
jgi:hypothetical protein